MQMVFVTFLFMVIAGAAFAIAHPFVKRWQPLPRLAPQMATAAISALLLFVSVYFFTAWGYNPAVIQVNMQQSLNPLRWVNWLLSALSFGVAQAFVFALVRNRIEPARRLGALPPPSAEPERVLEDAPAPVETEQPASSLPPGGVGTHTYASPSGSHRSRFDRPPFRLFVMHHKKGVEP